MTRSNRRLTLHQIYSDDVPPLADSTWQQLPKTKHKSQRRLKAASKGNKTAEAFSSRQIEPIVSPHEITALSRNKDILAPTVFAQTVGTPCHTTRGPVTSYRPTRLPTIRTLLNKVNETRSITTAQNVFDMCNFYNKPYSLVSDLKANFVHNCEPIKSLGSLGTTSVQQHISSQSVYSCGKKQKFSIGYLLNDEVQKSPVIDDALEVPHVEALVCKSPSIDYNRNDNYQEDYQGVDDDHSVPIYDSPDKIHPSHKRASQKEQHSNAVFDAMDLLHCERPVYRF
ncbi:hypothetical protein CORT_0D00550 [Candida orthopsilosis Co 90-125]|uniref:Uncharacterized protein n=1 Tax=Candida orthopsilosis (strain 90-125) TaxID=1136231 RepID=H8X4G1_CANO9|nr:hypothetical protein CORT_0D00550 [Candida orthopsilosis Co 90-125]CCG22903.1 hypothetical protein CORT_0D00550 [Candida orthopsilosis Co 90-125]